MVLGREPNEIVEEIAGSMPIWVEKLNLVVGLSAITFSVISLNCKYTELVAWCFLGIIFLVFLAIKHYFPPHIKSLRQKKNKSELEYVILKGVEAHFFGFKNMFFSSSLYWVGICLLFAIANGAKGLFLDKVLPLLM